MPNPLSNDGMPTLWPPEIFAEKHGGDTDRLVEGLRIISERRRFQQSAHEHPQLNYCEFDRGKKQLELLQSSHGTALSTMPVEEAWIERDPRVERVSVQLFT